jgi:hypothetical protein
MIPIRMNHYPEYAQAECKWKHLSNGFSGITAHEPIEESASLPAGLLSGYVKEAVIGYSAQTSSSAMNDPGEIPFSQIFAKLNRWGLAVPVVKQLLAKICSENLIDDVYDELRQSYMNLGQRAWQRAWLFGHYFRGRFHTSAVLGMHAHSPWPVVPFIDTKMLDLMGGMPYDQVENRKMQYHMLKTEFPGLAQISLDRTSFDMRPLIAPYGRVVNRLLYTPRKYFYQWTSHRVERRYYRRTYDFSCAGWNAVREAAEPNRGTALQVLDESVLNSILPPPGERRPELEGSEVSSKAKLLTGFLLWSASYL